MYCTTDLDTPFITQLENDEVVGRLIQFNHREVCYLIIFDYVCFVHVGRTQSLPGGWLQHRSDTFGTPEDMPIRQNLPCSIQNDAGPQSIIHGDENDPGGSVAKDAGTSPPAQNWFWRRRNSGCEFGKG
jgi:hypothetical protein